MLIMGQDLPEEIEKIEERIRSLTAIAERAGICSRCLLNLMRRKVMMGLAHDDADQMLKERETAPVEEIQRWYSDLLADAETNFPQISGSCPAGSAFPKPADGQY